MKFNSSLPHILIILNFLGVFNLTALSQTHSWVNTINGPRSTFANSVALDDNKNVYLTGSFSDSVTYIKNDPTKKIYSKSNRQNDVYVMKLRPNGQLDWVFTLGGTLADVGFDIVYDKKGSFYVCGSFRDTVDFDPDTTIFNLSSTGSGPNTFIAKFDTSGKFIWAKSFKSTVGVNPFKMDIDPNGDIYITGAYYGITNFNTGSGTDTLTAPGTSSFFGFLAHLRANGNLHWVRKIGTTGNTQGLWVSTERHGNVWVTGNFYDSIFIGAKGIQFIKSARSLDGFVLKYDSSGKILFGGTFGASGGSSSAASVATDSFDNVYLCGYAISTIDLHPHPDSTRNFNGFGNRDIFLVKLDSSGKYLWGFNSGISRNEQANCLSILNNQRIVLSGYFQDSMPVSGSGSRKIYAPTVNQNIFITSYALDGSYLDGVAYGCGTAGNRTDKMSAHDNTLAVCGVYVGAGDFNPGSGIDSVFSANFNSQGFVQVFNLCAIQTELTDTSVCDSFLWNYDSIVYRQSGLWTYRHKSKDGCDSLIQLKLKILDKPKHYDTISVCDSFFWKTNRQWYYSSGNYQHILNTSKGCDSSLFLSLHISATKDTTLFYQACDSFLWSQNNKTYRSSGFFSDTLVGKQGCDSIVSLNLTLNNSSFSRFFETACDSFKWIDGKTYFNTHDSVIFIAKNTKGCDSIIRLSLQIHRSYVVKDRIFACDSFKWKNGKTYYISSDTSKINHQTLYKCDSTEYLDISIFSSTITKDIVKTCDSFKWINGKTYFNSNDTDIFIRTDKNGCDSIIQLQLDLSRSEKISVRRSACDSFHWIDGKTYYHSTDTPTYFLKTSQGCDSLIQLDLDINYSSYHLENNVSCDSFTWIDHQTYFESIDSVWYTLSNSFGCDSNIMLNLIIHKPSIDTVSVQACDSFRWTNGMSYSNSGWYKSREFKNSYDCDSFSLLHLEIFQSNLISEVHFACDSFLWRNGKSYRTSNNQDMVLLKNIFGCDSIIRLELTIDMIDRSVTRSNDTLYSAEKNAKHQWLDCDNNFSEISNETSFYFKPQVAGNYAVEIEKYDCRDTSGCSEFLLLNVTSTGLGSWKVFPNPFKHYIEVQPIHNESYTYRIFSIHGQSLLEKTVHGNLIIHLESLPAGLYFIGFYSSDGQVHFQKVTKD